MTLHLPCDFSVFAHVLRDDYPNALYAFDLELQLAIKKRGVTRPEMQIGQFAQEIFWEALREVRQSKVPTFHAYIFDNEAGWTPEQQAVREASALRDIAAARPEDLAALDACVRTLNESPSLPAIDAAYTQALSLCNPDIKTLLLDRKVNPIDLVRGDYGNEVARFWVPLNEYILDLGLPIAPQDLDDETKRAAIRFVQKNGRLKSFEERYFGSPKTLSRAFLALENMRLMPEKIATLNAAVETLNNSGNLAAVEQAFETVGTLCYGEGNAPPLFAAPRRTQDLPRSPAQQLVAGKSAP